MFMLPNLQKPYFVLIGKFELADGLEDNFIQTDLIIESFFIDISLHIPHLALIVKFYLFFKILHQIFFL